MVANFTVTPRISFAQALLEEAPGHGTWTVQVGGGISWLEESLSKTGSFQTAAGRIGVDVARRVGDALYVGLSLDGVGLGASGRAIVPGTGATYGPNFSGGWGIEQVLAISRWYPVADSAWFCQAGGGWAHFWSTRTGESAGSGFGIDFAAGYDIPMRHWSCRCSLSPIVSYSAGRIGSAETPAGIWQRLDYRIPSVSLALRFNL